MPEPVSADLRFELGYRPALDGVRAIAVLAVMAFHAEFAHSYGGYLGVDVFFVLSGFLITSLLVAEHDRHGTISLPRFYIRRARRLLPALFLVLLFVGLYYLRYPHASDTEGVPRDLLGTLFYVANWVAVAVEHVPGAINMLSHTWSLSIEEQFYLVWPLLLLVLLRAGLSRRTLLLIAAVGYVASCIERVVLLHRANAVTKWIFFATDARGGTLLLGCFLAMLVAWGLVPRWARRVAFPGAVVGLAFLAHAFISARYGGAPHRAFTEGLTGVGLSTGLVVFGVVMAPENPVARLLALPPVVWIGKVSYGLYLWHLPIDRVIRPGVHDFGLSLWPLQFVRLALTFGVVAVSYYVIEQPIRHGSWPWRRQRAVSPAPRR